MSDKKQNEQQQELRDLDVPEEQAEEVKGGLQDAMISGYSFKPNAVKDGTSNTMMAGLKSNPREQS